MTTIDGSLSSSRESSIEIFEGNSSLSRRVSEVYQAAAPAEPAESQPRGLGRLADSVRLKRDPLYFIRHGNVQKAKYYLIKQDPDTLLLLALKEEEPSICAWLQQQGAHFPEDMGLGDLNNFQARIVVWLNHLRRAHVAPDPDEVDFYAQTLGYGYKTANLMVLRSLCDEVSPKLHHCEVTVPPFLPISDLELHAHLRKYYPSFQQDWSLFLSCFDAEQKRSYLEHESDSLQVPERGKKLLKQMRRRVEQCFHQHPFRSILLSEWLEQYQPRLVIARSTGAEDSDQLPNAGGNESYPLVNTDQQSISNALGAVVGSTFYDKRLEDPRSIQQRLALGDRTVLTKLPFFPGLVQEMIQGHSPLRNENDILRSGVLFTRDPTMLDNTTLIETGLGNNHGIVSGTVTVDTARVAQTGRQYRVVRMKHGRMVGRTVAHGKRELLREHIEGGAAELPALPRGGARDLSLVADHVALSYGETSRKAMDLEYSFQFDPVAHQWRLYLFQARPMVRLGKANSIKPRYLNASVVDHMRERHPDRVQDLKALLDGGGRAVRVRDSKQVLFARDMVSALEEYLDNANRENIQAIIVQQGDDLSSHACVTLQSKGVMALVARSAEQAIELEKWVLEASKEQSVWIDPQRGIILRPHRRCSVRSGKMSSAGWIAYPAPCEYSVPNDEILDSLILRMNEAKVAHQKELFKKYQERMVEYVERLDADGLKLIQDLYKGSTDEDRLLLKRLSTKRLMERVATEDSAHARYALACVLERCRKCWQQSLAKEGAIQRYISKEFYLVYREAIRLIGEDLLPAVESKELIPRLLPLRFLEATLMQEPNAEILNSLSLRSAMGLMKAQQDFSSHLKSGADSPLYLYCAATGKYALNVEVQKAWDRFVNGLLERDTALVLMLVKLLEELSSAGLVSTWINTSFVSCSEAESAQMLLVRLQEEWRRSKDVVHNCQREAELIEPWESEVTEWANPRFYSTHRKSFLDTMKRLLDGKGRGQESMKKRFHRADRIGKLAILENVRRAVAVFDQTLKSVKSSPLYGKQEQAAALAILLDGFLDLHNTVAAMLPKSELDRLAPNGTVELTYKEYMSRLMKGGSYKLGYKGSEHEFIGFKDLVKQSKGKRLPEPAIQLEGRREFQVGAIMLGSVADVDFSVHWPDSLEDYFTLWHQNTEKLRKMLLSGLGIDRAQVKGAAGELIDSLCQTFQVDVSHLTIDDQQVVDAEIQVPLRQHAATVHVLADPRGVTLSIALFGEDEHRRWDQVASTLTLWAGADPAVELVGEPDIHYPVPRGVSASVRITGDSEIVKLLEYLFLTVSMRPTSVRETLTFVLGRLGEKAILEEDPIYFQFALHHTNQLLQLCLVENKPEKALSLVEQTVEGLLHYGISDYDRGSTFDRQVWLPVKLGELEPKSVITGVLRTVAELRQRWNLGRDVVKQWLGDPRVTEHLPQLCEGLKKLS